MTNRRLWAPWRLPYIAGVGRPQRSSGCLFCQKGRSRSDAKNLVLARAATGFALLNLFPYNNGHLMAAPYRHVGAVGSLSEEEWLDLWRLADEMISRLGRTVHPHGYNVGFNLGRAAGAGIPGHLHLHVVPRWNGDTNFMPVLGHTKVVSQSLAAAHRLLSKPRRRAVRR